MKMIEAIIRPNKVEGTLEKLAEQQFYGTTRISVLGRGKQLGLKVGDIYYDEIPKEILMLVVHDEDVAQVVEIIIGTNQTGETGSIGDGKIFIKPVLQAVTISNGKAEL